LGSSGLQPEFEPGWSFPVTLDFPQIIGITRGSEAPLNNFLKPTLKTGFSYWDYIKIEKLHSEGNSQQNEKAHYRMGEDICK